MTKNNNFSHQISRNGLQKLQLEYDKLLNSRPDLVKRLDDARRMGDLSENSEYHAAKESLEFLDGRIFELKELIKTAVIVENDLQKDKIGMGSFVELELVGQNQSIKYQIVGAYEADLANGKISSTSPLGMALIEHAVGDTVQVTTPRGESSYKVLTIS